MIHSGILGPGIRDVTELLLHGDGANGSTTFTDSSKNNRTISRYGNAQIATTAAKFGGASIRLDGNGDSIYTDANTPIGSGDFTVDFWMRRDATKVAALVDFRAASGNNDPVIRIDGSNQLLGFIDGADRWTSAPLGLDLHHVALIRASGVARLFLDGTKVGSDYATASSFASASFTMGAYITNRGTGIVTDHFNGWIDEFRYLKGHADWSVLSFTPPASAYSI